MLLDLGGLGRPLARRPDQKSALDGRLDFDQLTDVTQLLVSYSSINLQHPPESCAAGPAGPAGPAVPPPGC